MLRLCDWCLSTSSSRLNCPVCDLLNGPSCLRLDGYFFHLFLSCIVSLCLFDSYFTTSPISISLRERVLPSQPLASLSCNQVCLLSYVLNGILSSWEPGLTLGFHFFVYCLCKFRNFYLYVNFKHLS